MDVCLSLCHRRPDMPLPAFTRSNEPQRNTWLPIRLCCCSRAQTRPCPLLLCTDSTSVAQWPRQRLCMGLQGTCLLLPRLNKAGYAAWCHVRCSLPRTRRKPPACSPLVSSLCEDLQIFSSRPRPFRSYGKKNLGLK